MIKLTVKFLCISALLFSFIVIAGCGGKTTVDNAAPNNAKKETPKTDAPKTDEKTDVAPAGDSVGVPECDDYIAKYEACLNKHVPEAARGVMKDAFQKQRDGFKQAAANPAQKAELPGVCKKVIETAKTSMAAYKCDW